MSTTASPAPRVIVTCGPSYEPIDAVRRLTNHSTGDLGILLSNQLAEAGCEVECCIGIGATSKIPLNERVHRNPFTTNDHLHQLLNSVPDKEAVSAVFHAAALCDFRVREARGTDGAPIPRTKISSRDGDLTVILEPTPKLIRELRPLFPEARLIGWKYEVAGEQAEALGRARRQILENATDACVINGNAYGPGFGILLPDGSVTDMPDKISLAQRLTAWIQPGAGN